MQDKMSKLLLNCLY